MDRRPGPAKDFAAPEVSSRTSSDPALFRLLYPDDRSEMTEAEVQYDDAAVHLEFVPEGDFLLKVSDARDVTRLQGENTPGYTPRFHEEARTVRTYGDTEQPLVVKGDTSDVVALVPEGRPASAK